MKLFEFSDLEAASAIEWDKAHECSLKDDRGAIGGRLSYTFTPTSLGCIIKVKCGCGAELDLTAYDEW